MQSSHRFHDDDDDDDDDDVVAVAAADEVDEEVASSVPSQECAVGKKIELAVDVFVDW
jgi:hypothetical protein